MHITKNNSPFALLTYQDYLVMIEPQIQQLQAIADEVLKEVIKTVALPSTVSTQNVFHDLVSCVLEQQIHYRSTKNIFQKILTAADLAVLTPDNFAELEEKGFGNYKLSMQKYETLLQLVAFFKENNIQWQQLEDEAVRELLVKIKGISNWTVDMILLYTLERADVFPVDDYHIKQIMTHLYSIRSTEKLRPRMKEIAANWAPYRSLAVKYLLAWKTFIKRDNRNM